MASLLLRADAGGTQGSGHVMRVAALGQAWAARGGRSVLASAAIPENVATRIAQTEGLNVVRLGAPAWSSADIAAVKALAAREGAKAIVVNSYLHDANYLAALGEGGLSVIVIDDMGRLDRYPCDVIVNQNLHAEASLYEDKAPGAVQMLGPSFAILRPEFARERGPRNLTMIARRLLVTFGGVDPKGASLKALDVLRLLGNAIEAELIIGGANPQADAIAKAAAGLANVTIERSVPDMAARLARADMVLSAGGTTTWEAACMGAPMMLVASAPEEAFSAQLIAKGEMGRFVGPVEALDARALAAAIEDFAGDLAARARSSVLGQALVDGNGAARVADAIARLIAA